MEDDDRYAFSSMSHPVKYDITGREIRWIICDILVRELCGAFRENEAH
jgi:hypothetical protein